MKKLIVLALLATMMVGCAEETPKSNRVDGFNIITVDSCEYIVRSYYKGGVMAHKGNCKYCLERNKKMIKAQIDTALIETFD